MRFKYATRGTVYGNTQIKIMETWSARRRYHRPPLSYSISDAWSINWSDSEPYYFRSAIVSAIGQIVAKTNNQKQNDCIESEDEADESKENIEESDLQTEGQEMKNKQIKSKTRDNLLSSGAASDGFEGCVEWLKWKKRDNSMNDNFFPRYIITTYILVLHLTVY